MLILYTQFIKIWARVYGERLKLHTARGCLRRLMERYCTKLSRSEIGMCSIARGICQRRLHEIYDKLHLNRGTVDLR